MPKIRTHNKRRKVAQKRKVQDEALVYHQIRGARLAAAGRWDKLRSSGWIRRNKKRAKASLRAQREYERNVR